MLVVNLVSAQLNLIELSLVVVVRQVLTQLDQLILVRLIFLPVVVLQTHRVLFVVPLRILLP